MNSDFGTRLDMSDADAGPNLEFAPDFAALERAAQGRPEQQYGDTIIPPEGPDWKDVERQALALTEQTLDLRILGHLAVAKLNLFGFPAYAAIVRTMRNLLESRWEDVHPKLDPEDANDPTPRANALLLLRDARHVLKVLRDLPLADGARAGRVTWRDITAAAGTPDGEVPAGRPAEPVIRAAFVETDQMKLLTLQNSVAECFADVAAILAAFDTRCGYATGPDLDSLTRLLTELTECLGQYAPPTVVDVHLEEAVVQAVSGQPGVVTGPGASALALKSITTRGEAAHLLELVLGYYARCEPSSPLPLLVDRARRLIDKTFMDVLRDLAPDGVQQAQVVAGLTGG